MLLYRLIIASAASIMAKDVTGRVHSNGQGLPGVVVTALLKGAAKGRLTALRYFAACLAGCVVVVYAFGITMQSVMTGVPFVAVALASTGFIIGDLVKAAVAALAVAGISRL